METDKTSRKLPKNFLMSVHTVWSYDLLGRSLLSEKWVIGTASTTDIGDEI